MGPGLNCANFGAGTELVHETTEFGGRFDRHDPFHRNYVGSGKKIGVFEKLVELGEL